MNPDDLRDQLQRASQPPHPLTAPVVELRRRARFRRRRQSAAAAAAAAAVIVVVVLSLFIPGRATTTPEPAGTQATGPINVDRSIFTNAERTFPRKLGNMERIALTEAFNLYQIIRLVPGTYPSPIPGQRLRLQPGDTIRVAYDCGTNNKADGYQVLLHRPPENLVHSKLFDIRCPKAGGVVVADHLMPTTWQPDNNDVGIETGGLGPDPNTYELVARVAVYRPSSASTR